MIKFKKQLKYIEPYFFIIRFVLLFVFLYLLFPFFRGIVAPGGDFYSPLAESYFNVVKAFTIFLTSAAKGLLTLIGYHVNQNDYKTIRIEYSSGIIVNPSCLGWGVMSFWSAFVIAHAGHFWHRCKWVLVGLSLIICLNIFRIALIALANYLRWTSITHLDHHLTFNIISYCLLVLLVIWYVSNQRKYDRKVLVSG